METFDDTGITNGHFAEYFSTVCKSKNGYIMLLIERSAGGVETKPIKTAYSPAAGTCYVTFTNVKVPRGNLLGKEGKGLYVVLTNFNHERFGMTTGCIRAMRGITEECMKWSNVSHPGEGVRKIPSDCFLQSNAKYSGNLL